MKIQIWDWLLTGVTWDFKNTKDIEFLSRLQGNLLFILITDEEIEPLASPLYHELLFTIIANKDMVELKNI
jgi:hypothetical protein